MTDYFFVHDVPRDWQDDSWTIDWETVRGELRTANRTINDLTRRSTSSGGPRRGSNGESLKNRLTREVCELVEAMAVLAQQLTRRREQVRLIELYPVEDPCAEGDVLIFTRKFPNDETKSYDYTARKTDSGWYVTGKSAPQGVTWEKLISWLGVGTDPRGIVVVTFGSATTGEVETRKLV